MKDQLIQLIDTFVAARVSGNAVLQQYASNLLSTFLQQVEVIERQASSPEDETPPISTES